MHHFGGMGAPWCPVSDQRWEGVCFARSGCRITNGQGVVLARRTQMSDDISFFDNIKGFDMVMSLDFYTKAVFKRESAYSAPMV